MKRRLLQFWVCCWFILALVGFRKTEASEEVWGTSSSSEDVSETTTEQDRTTEAAAADSSAPPQQVTGSTEVGNENDTVKQEEKVRWGASASAASAGASSSSTQQMPPPLHADGEEAQLGEETQIHQDDAESTHSEAVEEGESKRGWGGAAEKATEQTTASSHPAPISVGGGAISESHAEEEDRVAVKEKRELVVKEEPTLPDDETSTQPEEEGAAAPKRLWGSGTAPLANEAAPKQQPQLQQQPSSSNDTTAPHHSIPFVPGRHNTNNIHHINPPEGYTLAARVYIGTDDKLAHLDRDVTLPYFDCGATGSTTAPVQVKHAYVRHSLSAPTAWNEPGIHPVLAVALRPCLLEVSSGETLELQAGEIVLLEDGLRPGHVMRPIHPHANLSVLFLTLPQHHHHIGKEHLSIRKAVTTTSTRNNAASTGCLDTMKDALPQHPASSRNSTTTLADSSTAAPPRLLLSDVYARRLRLTILSVVALSVSTLAADFLGKTAPLWLAVGVGGTCFVVGSTYGLVVLADHALTAWELWRERRRLVEQRRK